MDSGKFVNLVMSVHSLLFPMNWALAHPKLSSGQIPRQFAQKVSSAIELILVLHMMQIFAHTKLNWNRTTVLTELFIVCRP